MNTILATITTLSAFSLAAPTFAQIRSDSARVIVLPDVAIQDRIERLSVSSGTEDRRTWHVVAPGSGCAVRFQHPRAGYHELRQLRLYLDAPGFIKDGGLRVRVASVTASGQPAADNLLPQPVVLDTRALRRSRRVLTLHWPDYHLTVPSEGFFLIIEGVGQQPDEVIGGKLPPTRHHRLGFYEIKRVGNSAETLRVVDVDWFPKLRGADYTGDGADVWWRNTKTGEWGAAKIGNPIPMLEAVFE
ncbi:hypothetical protein EJV47_09235 [Hymenobacter gummosus]|uniref:Uncharacterized protein n=1 Tax=Hymenobacter gummosus TaxID=1776032 RepID=A0A3S0IPM7_9BACT|nr:hypothetical protein [Hymenobacter gummosus]RTQ50794.1 hypothetical protein EJV47_09235 [Hymenobacter gummosus]